jgi:hypothetical protein
MPQSGETKMASLRDREVAVSDKNDKVMGPSGRKKRSADSFYLEVGGSSDSYNVTINFKSPQGHWCEKFSGARCHGNGNGKSRTYGKPPARDKYDPKQWCKHVQAALADVEKLAEAQERTAVAFGHKAAEEEAELHREIPADFSEPVKAEPIRATDEAEELSSFPEDRKVAAERLEELRAELAEKDAEREALAATIAEGREATLAAEIKVLCDEYGTIAVGEALEIYANGSKAA